MESINTTVLTDAITNTWFYPKRDRHYLLKPFQLTGFGGVRGNSSGDFKSYTTPDNVSKYILYNFSGINPSYYGLSLNFWEWHSIEDICKEQDISTIAIMNNRMLALDGIRFQYTTENEMIIAIPAINYSQLFYTKAGDSSGGIQVGNLLPYDHDITGENVVSQYPELFIRFYSNEYFSTTTGQSLTGLHTKSVICNTINDAQSLIGSYNSSGYRNEGCTQWYLDGYLVDEPVANVLNRGEVLQYRHDSSCIGYFDTLVDNLISYNSTLDKKDKYLIIPPPHVTPDSIYWDDVEIYVCGETNPNNNPPVAMKGFFFGREKESDITQLTHRDFSISAEKVSSIITEQSEMGVILNDNAFIRVFYRYSVGYQRPRLDSSYLLDLNKLPYHVKYVSLTSSNGPSMWRPNTLEQSSYINWATSVESELQTANYSQIKESLSYIGYQEIMTDSYFMGSGAWSVPKLARVYGATIVDLDKNGKLLNVTRKTTENIGEVYFPTDLDTSSVLFYSGKLATDDWSSVYEEDVVGNQTPSYFLEYRYHRPTSLSVWSKAELGVHYTYNADTNALSWNDLYATSEKRKRLAGTHAYKRLSISLEDYYEPIDIMPNGLDYISTGFSRWEVWLNGKKLVQNVGFVIVDQLLHLCDKEFWISDSVNADLVVIAYALPGDELVGNIGFVINDCINYNEQFDILRYRGTKLFVEGNYRELDSVYLAENYMGNQSFTISDSKVYDYSENYTYKVGQVAMYLNRLPLVCIREITTSSVKDDSAWVELSSTSTYKVGTSDTYVSIVPFGSKVKVIKTYEGGVKLVGKQMEAVNLSVSYKKVLGIPLDNPVSNGSLYEAYNAPMLVSDTTAIKYSDTPAEYKATTVDIGNWLSTQLPALPTTENIFIPNQHRIVSLFMQMIIKGLVDGTITVPNINASLAAVSIALSKLEKYRLADPARPGNLDSRFIMIYPHVGKQSLGLTAAHVNFLYKVNEYYFENSVNMTLNIHIKKAN
jgi:hypothetical protein